MRRMPSILLIINLVCSGLVGTMLFNSNSYSPEAASTWSQTSDRDFNNGTSDNITIVGSGENAELQIDLSEDYHWKKQNPLNSPIRDMNFGMATICTDDKVVLFGGYNYNDKTWEYDLSNDTWIDKTPYPRPPNYPSGISSPAMASLYGDDKAILFGGNDASGIHKDDTWEYDSSTGSWTDQTKTTRPPRRSAAGMASIYGTNKVLMFGGFVVPSTSFYIYQDTWIYDSGEAAWTNKTPPPLSTTYPGNRCFHAMASIWGTDKVLLFGGRTDRYNYNYFDDTWLYDYSDDTWRNMTPMGESPIARANHRMASVWGDDKIILFGGRGSVYYALHNTWVYDLSDNVWTKVILRDTLEKPNRRDGFGFAAIDGQDKIILFGGRYSTGMMDTWTYTHFLPLRNGTYVSSPYDTGAKSDFNNISWYANIPEKTTIKLQVRAAVNESILANQTFVGPDGARTSFYTSSPTDIWSGHDGDRWVQYKAYFNISILKYSPGLKDVTISYNCLPNTTVVSPINDTSLTINNPTFKWSFIDVDSVKQKAFQVQISDDINFEDVTFDSGEQSSAEEYWEFPTGTSYTMLPDGIWYWKVRTSDYDDTWTKFSTPRTLIIDSQIPDSSPIFPVNNGFYYNVNIISGKATEPINGSGINKVEITIKDLGDNTNWNGSTWVLLNTWLLVKGTTNWQYDSSNIEWISGKKYSIQSRAIDNATNIEQANIMNIFTIDQDNPKTIIENPVNNNWLNQLNIISGNSMDFSGAGVNRVEICVSCSKDYLNHDDESKENQFWDGKTWTPVQTWLPAIGTSQWSYETAKIPWVTGDHYTIQSRATDKTGNVETPGAQTTFMYDDTPPNNLKVSINNETEYTRSSSLILSLQAEDIGSGLNQMSFSTDSALWSEWEPFNTTRLFELSTGDGKKTIFVKVRDFTSNIAAPVSGSIILDTTPPEELSIVIDDNSKFTNSKLVKLKLKAIDKLSGINEISFSYDGSNWLSWEPFIQSKNLTLPNYITDGGKRVFFRVNDKAGNVAEPVYDTIILDTLPPHSLSIIIIHGLPETNSTSVTLALHAIDNTSGISQISFSNDGESWSAWEDYLETRTYELPSGDGIKTIYFKVKDLAGNEAASVSNIIMLNTTIQENVIPTEKRSSSGLNFWMIMFIIATILFTLIIAGILVIMKRQKRNEQKLLASGALTIRPGSLIESVISLDQMTKAIEQPRLPSVAGVTGSQGTSVNLRSTPVLELVKSTQSTPESILQESGSTQAPPHLPQLPPVQSQISVTPVLSCSCNPKRS